EPAWAALGADGLPVDDREEAEVDRPPLLSARALLAWRVLAQRYAEEPAVIAGLARPPSNEADNSPRSPHSLLAWGLWRQFQLALLGQLRRHHPRCLAVIEGLENDVSHLPLHYNEGSLPANVVMGVRV